MTHALQSGDPLTYWNEYYSYYWQAPAYGNVFNFNSFGTSYYYSNPFDIGNNMDQQQDISSEYWSTDIDGSLFNDFVYDPYMGNLDGHILSELEGTFTGDPMNNVTSGTINDSLNYTAPNGATTNLYDQWEGLNTIGDQFDNITSGMGALDVGSVGELFDLGIAIPVFTIGIDVYQQIKLLSQGKTNLATSTKHIVAHAAVSMTGTAIGSTIGTAILPGVGTVIGGIVGVMVGNKLYNKARTAKLKECINRINQRAQQAHEELNEMVSLVESGTHDKVNEELKSIKEEINKRKPEPLKTFLMKDSEISKFISNKTVCDGNILSYLKSPQFRNEMVKDPYKSQRLLRLLLVLLDKYKGAWYLWMITAKTEVQKKQGTVAKQFQVDLEKINSRIETSNNELETLKAEAQRCADKLGIVLNLAGEND